MARDRGTLRHSTARTGAGVVALVLTLGFAACASEDVNSTGAGGGEPSRAADDDGRLTFTDRLPPRFPDDVPIPDAARIVNATTNGTTFSATFERSATTPDAAVTAYRAQLESAQFLVPDANATPFASVSAIGHGWTVNLIATPADADVVLSLSVAPA